MSLPQGGGTGDYKVVGRAGGTEELLFVGCGSVSSCCCGCVSALCGGCVGSSLFCCCGCMGSILLHSSGIACLRFLVEEIPGFAFGLFG